MGLDNKTTEDLYQKLASDIIWRLGLTWDKTFGIIYEYLKNNIKELEDFSSETVNDKFTVEDNASGNHWRIYRLTQDGSVTNCILVSYNNGSIKFLPMKYTSISELLENGIKESQELMSFRTDQSESDDETKKWIFTKQVINCLGTFQEHYEPLERKIETVFYPLDIFLSAFEQAKNYDLDKIDSSAYIGDRKLASWNDFVEHLSFESGFKGTTITAMETRKRNIYKIEIIYPNGTKENERISADSLYGAYIIYMEKHGYYGVEDKVGKHKVYCTENQD